MSVIKKIAVFGDSILKGIQINKKNQRYHVDNNIDAELLSRRFGLEIKNHSKFGLTVTKGAKMLEKFLKSEADCEAVVMDFGGNDCDFDWRKVAENPGAEHLPNTPLSVFEEVYSKIIARLKSLDITPILTTLPPLDPQRFFDWFCKSLNKDNILNFLGSVTAIYRFQENYSRVIEKIAMTAGAPLVDLRGAFLKHRKIEHLLCEDGTHPNTAGQAVITSAFFEFCESFSLQRSNMRLFRA
ncbi:MAG: SGNH/GDSL hydrolase family protein [Oscillospiraceae bacterium]|jgi:lysophospholipase L1-like esterase|nr:SGNH/GDSL hydrolase family protein [Oscillospiraceae bacterium]